jgi:hypothetical protein
MLADEWCEDPNALTHDQDTDELAFRTGYPPLQACSACHPGAHSSGALAGSSTAIRQQGGGRAMLTLFERTSSERR